MSPVEWVVVVAAGLVALWLAVYVIDWVVVFTFGACIAFGCAVGVGIQYLFEHL